MMQSNYTDDESALDLSGSIGGAVPVCLGVKTSAIPHYSDLFESHVASEQARVFSVSMDCAGRCLTATHRTPCALTIRDRVRAEGLWRRRTHTTHWMSP